jgi:hypothetical protein
LVLGAAIELCLVDKPCGEVALWLHPTNADANTNNRAGLNTVIGCAVYPASN